VATHGVDGFTIFDCKAEHIVCRVPTSNNVMREDTGLQFELLAIETLHREGDSC